MNAGWKVTIVNMCTLQQFILQKPCVQGFCKCMHYIGGRIAQLKPCRFFSELFFRGDVDPDWWVLLSGVVFGFSVINKDCSIAHNAFSRKQLIDEHRNLVELKLQEELVEGINTEVSEPPTCMHNIFVVPKDEGV